MKKTTFPAARMLAAVAAPAAALLLLLAPQTAAAKKNKNIGIQLYSVMSAVQQDPGRTIERLTGMGYRSFELVQWGGDDKVFGLPAEEFRALCDRNGATIGSTHSGLQEDPAREEEIMQRWHKLFAIQKACGGRYFVIPGYQVGGTVAEVQRMCDYFNRVGRIAAEYGLKLGYHNHSHEYAKLQDSDRLMWEYMVEHTDPRYVCFELDVYWCAQGGQDPVAYLKKYPERIELLHVKDHFVIGESGEIDFEAIFKQFRKNGMSEYFVEIETPRELAEKVHADGSRYTQEEITEEVFEAARKSAEYLNAAKFVK